MMSNSNQYYISDVNGLQKFDLIDDFIKEIKTKDKEYQPTEILIKIN